MDLWYVGPIFPESVSDIFLSTRFEARVGGDMDGAENECLWGGLSKSQVFLKARDENCFLLVQWNDAKEPVARPNNPCSLKEFINRLGSL